MTTAAATTMMTTTAFETGRGVVGAVIGLSSCRGCRDRDVGRRCDRPLPFSLLLCAVQERDRDTTDDDEDEHPVLHDPERVCVCVPVAGRT